MFNRLTVPGFFSATALIALATGCAAALPETTETKIAGTQSQAEVAKELGDPKKPIYNYIEYSPTFASSGQPSEAQLQVQKDAGVERVIYIAFSDQEHSLPNEDRIIKELGLNYLQVPVDWKAPQKRDFDVVVQALKLEPERKTLLHCQANLRASAFALLYRVLHEGVPLATAKADMNKIWVPNGVWTRFILDVLEANNVASDCPGCDWTPSNIGD